METCYLSANFSFESQVPIVVMEITTAALTVLTISKSRKNYRAKDNYHKHRGLVFVLSTILNIGRIMLNHNLGSKKDRENF